MSKIVFSFFILVSAFTMAQEYGHVDKKVKKYPYYNHIDHLAHRIQNDFGSDMERVRAAFVWLTHNITYGKTMDEFFEPKITIIYYSERGKERQIKKAQDNKINQAFKNKRGVCYDYSMMMKNLVDHFGLESKIVRGIVKEDIRDVRGEKLYKNHAWNAIKINNEWRLMDPTWATGYWDESTKLFVRDFNDRYFDANPEEFIKDHFPAQEEWQLLKEPVALNTFYTAPIFLPGYFENNIELSKETSGLLTQTENFELIFAFEKFPHSTQLNYSIDSNSSTGRIRNIGVRKKGKQLYISKLRLNSALKEGQKITLYINRNPILEFKMDD
ncbi:transglutaminase domain-containing protein [Flagellimonas sp. S3867]|uniref:transglutaminase domain-containing protein n=1 Tax=Flagellimonas sp. S3867 TaxID=2768063 RepID=UPI001685214C|nr:transglutaminase domain-containing protein [Flagellimonas sp. S3867]